MQHFRSCVRRFPAAPIVLAASRARGRLAAGFTLIELMVTVAIVGILLATGVPAMQRFLTARAVAAQADELAESLRQARSHALKLNTMVALCASTNTTAAAPTCAGTASWNSGWLMFIDQNDDGTRASTERILRVQSPLSSINGINSGSTSQISFFSNGLSKTGAATFEVQPKIATSDSGYLGVVRRVCLYSGGRVVIMPGTSSC